MTLNWTIEQRADYCRERMRKAAAAYSPATLLWGKAYLHYNSLYLQHRQRPEDREWEEGAWDRELVSH